MAVDYQLYAFTDEEFTEEERKIFFCNHIATKWFNMDLYHKQTDELADKVFDLPNICLGDTFCPALFDAVAAVITDVHPVVDDEHIQDIHRYCADLPEKVTAEVFQFLEKYKGKRMCILAL